MNAENLTHITDDRPAAEPATPDEGRVIVIGWQVLLIPLVILAVVGGYLVGQRISAATNPAPTAQPVAVANPATGFGQAPLVVTIDASQLQQLTDPSSLLPSGPVELPPPSHPLIGQMAPDFEMKVVGADQRIKLSDYRGDKVVMVNFWATWCPPCRMEMPWLQNVYTKYKDQGLELLAVDAGERVPPEMVEDRIKQYVDRMGLTFPVVMGDNTYDVQRDYSVYGLPSTFIVDKEGRMIDFHNAMYPNEATIDAQVQKALAAAEG
ncbi:MAG: TlpA family protein disulfide reductase [Chloroflexi bacterium CFX6]|nr:TlpA family protein disulfide reductase [Chloroflexi bacterium CFX6]